MKTIDYVPVSEVRKRTLLWSTLTAMTTAVVTFITTVLLIFG